MCNSAECCNVCVLVYCDFVSSCPCIVKNSEAPDVCVCMCWFLYLSVVYVSMVEDNQ